MRVLTPLRLLALLAILAILGLPFIGCGGSRSSAPPAPSFSLRLAPAQVRLLPSAKATTTVIVTGMGDYSGPVDLEAFGLGGDLVAQFEPARVEILKGASVQALLTVQAADTAPKAERILEVRARSSVDVASADLRLDIPAATIFPVTTFLNEGQANVSFLAYQDGDGPWMSVAGQGGLYKLPITDASGRFGLIYGAVCRVGDFESWDINAFNEALSETQALYAAFFCNPKPGPPATTFDLGGALRNTGGQSGLISASTGLWSFDGSASRYDMKLYKGTADFAAALYPDLGNYIPSRILVERARDTQAASSRDLDFGSEGADPLPREAIARPVLETGETFRGSVQYQTSRGQSVILGNGQDLAQYAPFPPAAALSGDAYVYGFQASTFDSSRTVVGSTPSAPGPITPRLPSPFAPYTVNLTGSPRLRPGLAWDAISPKPRSHAAALQQRAQNQEAYWYVAFSKARIGEGPRFTWNAPDLEGVPGFDAKFLFRPGIPVNTQMSQSGNAVVPTALEEMLGRLEAGKGAPGLNGVSTTPGVPGVPRKSAFRVRRVPTAEASGTINEYFYANRAINLTP